MPGFSRIYRLSSDSDFQFVFAKPHKVKHHALIALYRSNKQPVARLGIIVNKHHVRLAVGRNRIKRLIRESFRHVKDKLKGLDIIVLIRSKCSPADKLSFRNDVDHLWQLIISSSKV